MKIGPIQLPSPFCQAGLAGYSDRAMRVVARRHGCPYAVTEALLDTILCNGGNGLRKSIDINDEDHPVAGQIIGAEPETMSRAASLLQQAGYDVIDLNFACPVKKIKNKARGGHMLLDVPRALSILKSVRDTLPPGVPTTISLRRAFDDSPEAEDRFFEIAEAAWANGYSTIRVHGRTVEQKYNGAARWASLRDIKRRYPDRTILGSGDVFTAEDAVRMLRETGVDIVWIARGAIGNPWIFEHARALLSSTPSPCTQGEGGGEGSSISDLQSQITTEMHPLPEYRERESEIAPPSIRQQRDALREHFAIAMEIHGEQLAGRRMRKMGIKYSRFHPLSADVKTQFINVRSLRDWTGVLDRFYAADGPGVWPDPKAADEVNDDLQGCELAPESVMKHRAIAIILFDDAEELDYAGPWEVFSYFRKQHPELATVFTVSETGGEIRSAKGLRVIADHSFDTAPAADIVVVPGGVGRKKEVDNPRMIEFLKRCADRAEVMSSVCTGAFLLERAGLLTGRRATTHWSALDELRAKGTVIVTPERYVDEEQVVTASGVSAGIDMSLYLIGKLWSRELARRVQKGIEYFPEPPYQDVPIPQ